LALARSPGAAGWEVVSADPGAVLLLVRHSPALRTLAGVSFVPALLANPDLLEDVLRNLDGSAPGWINWAQPAVRPVYESALGIAATARAIAQADKSCDPDTAWIAGLLAPLGWLGVAAVDASAVAECLVDPEFSRHPVAVQQRRWGLDAQALARRLARRWRLPAWLAASVGHLGLPVEMAGRFGAEPNLFRVVQQAIAQVEENREGLRLLGEYGPLSTRYSVDGSETSADSAPGSRTPRTVLRTAYSVPSSTHPADVPLLKDLLRLAAVNLRLQGLPTLDQLESDFDDLHAVLEEQRAAEAERLREQKLRALAEFAAGAGHEINNPLAVISGQAQYLLKQLQSAECRVQKEEGPLLPENLIREQFCNLQSAICNSQKTIITQTQRIHQILRDLMQFARPPQPVKQAVDLGILVRETATALSELAAQRQVRLDCIDADTPLYVEADPDQIRTALSCLLRNAIEAAPGGPDAAGWASIQLAAPHAARVEVIIEDNGPGPAAVEREHLFDPFFSGRPAGRGRGLGLPTAWRLARQHGGDVTFARQADGPTRFVLSLPRLAAHASQAAA
jgi:signal transduction histidine kinase